MANEVEARQVIQNLIDANASTLVNSLIVYNQQRVIAHNTISTLTPPQGYYYVVTEVEFLREQTEANLGRVNVVSQRRFEYDMVTTFIDYLTDVAGENELYETMDIQFQTLTDRFINLLAAQENLNASARYFLKKQTGNDRAITKQNNDVTWMDAETYYAVKVCEIRYTLVGCE